MGSHSFGSCSRLSHASHIVEPKVSESSINPGVLEAHEEVVVDLDAPLESYSGGPFDTSLLHLYAIQAGGHVWHVEVYFFSFAIHMLLTN